MRTSRALSLAALLALLPVNGCGCGSAEEAALVVVDAQLENISMVDFGVLFGGRVGGADLAFVDSNQDAHRVGVTLGGPMFGVGMSMGGALLIGATVPILLPGPTPLDDVLGGYTGEFVEVGMIVGGTWAQLRHDESGASMRMDSFTVNFPLAAFAGREWLVMSIPPEDDCFDGEDNDLDGRTDCADQDCSGDDECFERDCTDGVDDDFNGQTDCRDSACSADPHCTERACGDGVDSDADGATDCADTDCARSPDCVELFCDDGADSDHDALVDCEDPDCAETMACKELFCSNGTDEDGDALVDCADPDCAADAACREIFCRDAADNDGDALIDCADPDCATDDACVDELCGDALDNDGDALVDCADPDCAQDASCL